MLPEKQHDGTPRPAVGAVRRAAEWHSGRPAPPPGRAMASHWPRHPCSEAVARHAGEARQPGAFQIERGLPKDAVRESRGALRRRAARVQHGFDIVQVEHRAAAGGANRFQVRRAPEMLDHAQSRNGGPATASGNPAFEAREAVDQRRNVARHAHGVAHEARAAALRPVGGRSSTVTRRDQAAAAIAAPDRARPAGETRSDPRA